MFRFLSRVYHIVFSYKASFIDYFVLPDVKIGYRLSDLGELALIESIFKRNVSVNTRSTTRRARRGGRRRRKRKRRSTRRTRTCDSRPTGREMWHKQKQETSDFKNLFV